VLLLLAGGIARAQTVETRWAVADEPPPPAHVIELSDEPPPGMKSPAAGLPVRFAVLFPRSHRLALAVVDDWLWIDADGDRTFGTMELAPGKNGHFRYDLRLEARGAPPRVRLRFIRDGDRLRASHAVERAGEVVLLGRVRPFRLRDGDFDLRFHNPEHDVALLDVDGDAVLQRHEGSHERRRVLDTFRIGEAGFACRVLDPGGGSVAWVRTDHVPAAKPRILAREPAPPSGRRAPGGGEEAAKRILESERPSLSALGATGCELAFRHLARIAREDGVAEAVSALAYADYAGHASFFERLATGKEPARVRIAAIEALHAAGIKGRELTYAQLIRDGEEVEVVAAAARHLAWARPTMVDPALRRVRDPARRTAIYEAARGHFEPATIEACAEQRSAKLRAMALRDLFLLGHERARALAVEAAMEPRPPDAVLEAVLPALGGAGSPEAVRVIFDLISLGRRIAEREGFRLLSLDRRERVVTAIAAHLESEQVAERRLAIRLLGAMPVEQAGEALAKRYGREDDDALDRLLQKALLAHAHPPLVRRLQRAVRRADDLADMQAEVEALVAIGQRFAGVRAALIELLEWRKWEARVLVLRALKPGPYPDLARACADNLDFRVWQVRLSAAEALARFRVRDGVGALVERLEEEEHARVREAIAATLQSLTGERLRDYPELWRKWWDREGSSFEVLAEAPKKRKREAAKGETKTVATFYGIPVSSNRVIFVLDRSGSMSMGNRTGGMTRLDRAKRELLQAVEGLPDKTRMNVVFFGTGAFEWRSRLAPLSRSTRRGLDKFLGSIDARGGTDMYDALALALSDDDVETIFLLSDGNPTGRHARLQDMLREVAKLNHVKRVQIHTIAIGYGSLLLRKLAEANGGTYKAR